MTIGKALRTLRALVWRHADEANGTECVQAFMFMIDFFGITAQDMTYME